MNSELVHVLHIHDLIVDELLRHTLTDRETWANERICSCGQNIHTWIAHRGYGAHVAESVKRKLDREVQKWSE